MQLSHENQQIDRYLMHICETTSVPFSAGTNHDMDKNSQNSSNLRRSIESLHTFFYSKPKKKISNNKSKIKKQKFIREKKKNQRSFDVINTNIFILGLIRSKIFAFFPFLCAFGSIYCTAKKVFHIHFSFIRNSQK